MWFGRCCSTVTKISPFRNGRPERRNAIAWSEIGSFAPWWRRMDPATVRRRSRLPWTFHGPPERAFERAMERTQAQFRRSVLLTALDRGAEIASDGARRT